MDRVPVSSSNIADIGYDPSTMTLEVGFLNGGVYQYFDVPEAVYEEFMRAETYQGQLPIRQSVNGMVRMRRNP